MPLLGTHHFAPAIATERNQATPEKEDTPNTVPPSSMLGHHHFAAAAASSMGSNMPASMPMLGTHHFAPALGAGGGGGGGANSPAASRSNGPSDSARSQPLLGLHHRLPPPDGETNIPEPATDDDNWMGNFLGNMTPGIPLPGEMRGHYANTSSESEFQYGDQNLEGQVRRELDRKALKQAEEVTRRRQQVMTNLDKLIKIVPHSDDTRTESIVHRGCTYIKQLGDSVQSAKMENQKLQLKIESIKKDVAERPDRSHLIKPDTTPRVHFDNLIAATSRLFSPTLLIFAMLLSTAVSPRRLILFAKSLLPQTLRILFDAEQSVLSHIKDIPLISLDSVGPAGMDMGAVFKGFVVTLVIRRMRCIAEEILIALKDVTPKQPSAPTPPPLQNHHKLSRATQERCASIASASGMQLPLPEQDRKVAMKAKAHSNVVAYLHSEGLEASGRIIERYQNKNPRPDEYSSGGNSASVRQQRRRSAGGHSSSGGIQSSRSRATSTASQKLLRLLQESSSE